MAESQRPDRCILLTEDPHSHIFISNYPIIRPNWKDTAMKNVRQPTQTGVSTIRWTARGGSLGEAPLSRHKQSAPQRSIRSPALHQPIIGDETDNVRMVSHRHQTVRTPQQQRSGITPTDALPPKQPKQALAERPTTIPDTESAPRSSSIPGTAAGFHPSAATSVRAIANRHHNCPSTTQEDSPKRQTNQATVNPRRVTPYPRRPLGTYLNPLAVPEPG